MPEPTGGHDHNDAAAAANPERPDHQLPGCAPCKNIQPVGWSSTVLTAKPKSP